MIMPAKDNLPIAPANARKGSLSGVLPYLGGAMDGWFTAMKLGVVRSVLEDYETREEITWKKFRGVVCCASKSPRRDKVNAARSVGSFSSPKNVRSTSGRLCRSIRIDGFLATCFTALTCD